jgi:hypothetical protein
MTSDRKKPGVAFWATVALVVVLLGYPLSVGPAYWLQQREIIRFEVFLTLYKPLWMLAEWSNAAGSVLNSYIGFFETLQDPPNPKPAL